MSWDAFVAGITAKKMNPVARPAAVPVVRTVPVAPVRQPAVKPLAVELFCGAGGEAIGLHRAGFHTVAAWDFDKAAIETYRKAGLADEVHQADVNQIDWKATAARLVAQHGPIDLVVGGPPCQSFSQAGKGLGDKDPRNGFPAFLEAVAAFLPRAVMIENVKGLTLAKHLWYLERIVASLEALGYTAQWKVLNAADYGVPQIRQRVFIVGFRRDMSQSEVLFGWPAPTHSEEALVQAKFVSGRYGTVASPPSRREQRLLKMIEAGEVSAALTLPRWRTVRDAIADIAWSITAPANLKTLNEKHPPLTMDAPSSAVRSGGDGHDAPPQYVPNHRAEDAIPVGPKSVTRNHPASTADSAAMTVKFGDRGGNKGIVDAGSFTTRTDHGVLDPDRASCAIKAGGNTDATRNHQGGALPPAIPAVLDSSSTTISAGGTSTGGAEPIPHMKRQGYLRRLTVREAARLQDFPDDIVFQGTKTAQYRQVGNACPPALTAAVAGVIRKTLEGIK